MTSWTDRDPMDDSRRCTATSKRSGLRCKRFASVGREVCSVHGGKSLRGVSHPGFRHGRYSKALPARLSKEFRKLLADPNLVGLRDELALLDVRIQQCVQARDWVAIERLLESRRRLVGTQVQLEAHQESTLTAEQALALAAALSHAVRKNVEDREVLTSIFNDIERITGGGTNVRSK